MPDRAVLFIDGNNWYHSLVAVGLADRGRETIRGSTRINGASSMAQQDEYDAAYLLSADGDYTPAVEAVTALGKTVYAVSPSRGAQLGTVVKAFIRLERDWFDDCF